ncbi:MAG: hypothetical protein V7K81_31270 [Nostoc sp.]
MKRLQISIIRCLRRVLPLFVIIGTITNVANFTINLSKYVQSSTQQQTLPEICSVKGETNSKPKSFLEVLPSGHFFLARDITKLTKQRFVEHLRRYP